jgi:hypothetical protein
MKEYIRIKEKKHIKYFDTKKEEYCLNQSWNKLEIAYRNNEVKKFYQDVNSKGKEFKPETL